MSIVKMQNNTYTVEALNQWDLNQVLRVYGLSLARVPEVHFSNMAMDRAIPRQATMDAAGVITVDIPNSLLQKPYTINAYICGYNGTTFETYYKLDIPVNKRPQPADYTLQDDDEVYSFKALENAVVNAKRDMNRAEATLKETNTTIDDKVDAKVKAALPDLLDSTLTSEDKAAQAAAVSAAIKAAVAANADTHLQIVTSSYTGDGTFGAENPTSLTFDFQPLFVMVCGGSTVRPLVWYEGVTKVGRNLGLTEADIPCSRTDNTLSWYDASNAVCQYNQDRTKYFYIAAGYKTTDKEVEQ